MVTGRISPKFSDWCWPIHNNQNVEFDWTLCLWYNDCIYKDQQKLVNKHILPIIFCYFLDVSVENIFIFRDIFFVETFLELHL